jgi:hypothetical protein
LLADRRRVRRDHGDLESGPRALACSEYGIRLAGAGSLVGDNCFDSPLLPAFDEGAGNAWSLPQSAGTNVCSGTVVAGNSHSDYVPVTELDLTGDGVPDGVGALAYLLPSTNAADP